MAPNPINGPGDDDLERMLGKHSPKPDFTGKTPDQATKSADKSLIKSKSGGLGGAGKKTLDDRARFANEQATNEDPPTAEMVKANTPGPETTEIKPKASLKKVGWAATKTYFKSDAEVYAEFDVPSTIVDRTLVEFELFREEKGGFKPVKKVQTHADGSGRATAKLPNPTSEEPKVTFVIKVKHCSSDWSSGQGTEREVSETAGITIEHTQVSGIHFNKGKSFIADIYIDVLCEVKKTYLEWKKTHTKAQIVVYGHVESDEQENSLAISRNRAMSAFLFIIGDVELWADLGEKERWGVWEQQCMLRALGFFKTKPTGNLGPITRHAIQDFITFLNEARCKNINPMLGLSEAYIRKELYREYLNLKRGEIELPSSAFRLVAGYPYVGCCAFNRYQAGETLYDENRRVVFLMLQESANFPAVFPCRSSTTEPCENESKKPGDRAMKGFRCKFYDEVVKQEKVGEGVSEPVTEQKITDDFAIFASTIYGESASQSEAAWHSIAHVIMNRLGSREWKPFSTPASLIQSGGFDAYTEQNAPYIKCHNYLCQNRNGDDRRIERFVTVIAPIYQRKEKDLTSNCVLYYSPNMQSKMHKTNPGLYKEKPGWNFNVLEEVKIDEILPTDDFKFFKYK